MKVATELPVCRWLLAADNGFGVGYGSDCGRGHVFAFTNDGPLEHGFEFCPYCGRVLLAKPIEGRRQPTMVGS